MPSKPVEIRVLGTLDEILYGETPNTALYSNPHEFEEARDIFKNAEIGKEFSGTVYWQEWMLPQVKEAVKQANEALHAYRGANEEKIKTLRQNMLCADFLMNFLKGIVEDAQTFPRPVFKAEQQ